MTALSDIAPTLQAVLQVALGAAGTANPLIGEALALAGPLLTDAFNAALEYASGTTQDPASAAAAFAAAISRYDAAASGWAAAEKATPAPDAPAA